MKAKNIVHSILAAELVLLVPLVAMFFTEEVDWNLPDFIIAGILLAGVGVAYQLIVTGSKNNTRQAVIGVVLAAAIVLLWAEMAVGVFGTPFAGS